MLLIVRLLAIIKTGELEMLQSSGPISAQDINTELQRSGSLSLSI